MARDNVHRKAGNLGEIDITNSVQLESGIPIGGGSEGDVYKGRYTYWNSQMRRWETSYVILKVLVGEIDNSRPTRHLLREIANWKDLKHPNILQFLGIAQAFPSRPPGLVSPYCEITNILGYIADRTKPGQGRERELALGVCRGLRYMHGKNVIHGDIKADNVILDHQRIPKIIDFGVGKILNTEGYTTITQMNARFAPPERLPVVQSNAVTVSRPTKEGDIWSLGMLFLQFFHRHRTCLPFNHIANMGALPAAMHSGDRPRRENYYDRIADQHWRLMHDCWTYDPSRRPTIDQVRSRL